jgi:hypothetical protein
VLGVAHSGTDLPRESGTQRSMNCWVGSRSGAGKGLQTCSDAHV